MLTLLTGGANPFDTYTYHAQLTTTWGIDGSIVRFADWGNYFVYSCFTDNGRLQSLCIAPLPTTGSIGEIKILSEPTETWEQSNRPVMEGPVALYHGGKTYLTYAASYCWTPEYSLGLLTWDGASDPSLESSWSKSGPLLTSANGNYGTGHNG